MSICLVYGHLGLGKFMGAKAREFIDFWVENSVHAAEEYGTAGGEQGAIELARRCLEMAASQGFSKTDIETEVGNLIAYLQEELVSANKRERDRQDRSKS